MIFLDSSLIVADKIENDQHHKEAAKTMNDIATGKYGNPLISDYIFDEILTVIFSRSKKLPIAIETGQEIRNSVEIRRITESDFEDAWQIFKNQKNTKLSFTDCTTLALMLKEGIRNIATFDQDFSKIKEINVVG